MFCIFHMHTRTHAHTKWLYYKYLIQKDAIFIQCLPAHSIQRYHVAVHLLFYHSPPTIHWSTASLLAGIWIVTHFIPHKVTSKKYQRWKIVDHPVELTSKNEHLIYERVKRREDVIRTNLMFYLAFQQVSGSRRSFLVLFHRNVRVPTNIYIKQYLNGKFDSFHVCFEDIPQT